MTWRLWDAAERKRVAILVSKSDHCLLDRLWRARRDEFEAEVVLVASNHPDAREDAESFGLPCHHVPVQKSKKAEAEAELLEILEGCLRRSRPGLLHADPLGRLSRPAWRGCHQHPPLVPARLRGPGPYARAKSAGSSSSRHGPLRHRGTRRRPIIEQDVIRVTHRNDVEALTRLGVDIERAVLAPAVAWHCEDRVLRHGNTTVVF